MRRRQRIVAILLCLAIGFSIISVPSQAKTSAQEPDDGIMAKWIMGPDGYDDGLGMNGAGGNDRAQKLPNGDRFVRYDNYGVWNARTALPVGAYYFKFLAKIKRGSDRDNLKENDRPFFVTIPGDNERTDRSGPLLKAFPDNEWITVSIPFVIGNNLAYRNIEYAIKGAMPFIVGGQDAEVYIGREIVVSRDNKPLVHPGVIAAYAMQGGYGAVGTVRGIWNDDRSRTYTGQDSMYEFKARLPEGQYWAKLITKTSGKKAGAVSNGEISRFVSSAGWSKNLPDVEEYEDGIWKNVIIPFTVDAESAGKDITYSILGPQNGAADLTIEEYLLICDNDRPLAEPQQHWRDREITAAQLANGIALNTNHYDGNRTKFNPAEGYLELKSTLGKTDRFVWDIGMNLSRKQFADSGYIHNGKIYMKVVAKVPVLANQTMQNEKLFSIEMRSGGNVVDTANFNYGIFTEADQYQTLVYEFDTAKHDSFGGNREWTVWFDARFFHNVSDLHIKSITISAVPEIQENSKVITNGILWPQGQQLPSFGTPADTLELVDIRENTDTMYRSAMTSLQGLVNKKQPRILCAEATEEAEGNGYPIQHKDYWPASLGLNYVHAEGANSNERILKMIHKYRYEIDGFILYAGASNNYNDLNVATTIGGIYNAIPVNQEILGALRGAPYHLDTQRWPVIRDLSSENFGSGTSSTAIRNSRVNAYTYLYENYSPAKAEAKGNKPYNDRIITIINPSTDGKNGHFAIRDLAAAVASPVVWLDAKTSGEKAILNQFYETMKQAHNNGLGAVAMGFWPSEEEGVKETTKAGITAVPSDNFENYTVYAGMSRVIDPPSVPKKPDLAGGKNYISLASSDGDNIAYLEHGMRYGQRTGDRTKGYFPINWTMTPALLDAAPQILQYYYNAATDNDGYIIGPDGYGYTRTETWPDTQVEVNGQSASWIQGYAALTNGYVERTGLNYPTLWGDVLSRTNRNRFSQEKLNQYADFRYFPALGGLYYLNHVGSSILPPANQTLKSTTSDVWAQWFNFSYYAQDGTGQGAIGNENSSASTSYTGTVYGRIKGLNQNLDSSQNTFHAVQIQNWTGGLVEKINALQDFSNRNYPKNQFVRADHYFMLMAEANGEPINNALQAKAYASSSDTGYEAAKAVDGSFGRSHGWQTSAQGEQWLVVDFGRRQNITRYVVKNAELAGYPSSYNTRGWKLQVSNDGRDWTTIDEVTGNLDGTVYRTAAHESARFVRILVTDSGADQVTRIQDIEIYGVNNWDRSTQTYTTYKEELYSQIAVANGLQQNDYTEAAWKIIIRTKEIAQETAGNATVSQTEIDTAMLALKDAIQSLTVDRTALEETIAFAESLVESDYSDTSWAMLQRELANAREANTDPLADQSRIHAVNTALKNAIDALTTDKTALIETMQLADSLQEADYPSDLWEAMQQSRQIAGMVKEDPGAKQSQIDAATLTLLEAIRNLGMDKEVLDNAIYRAKALHETEYSQASWQALQQALHRAIQIAEDENAKPVAIKEAAQQLLEAMSRLTVDKTELNETISSETQYEEKQYFPGSWKEFQTALMNAKEVAADPAAKQSDINRANAELLKAIAALQSIQTEYELLKAEIKTYSPKDYVPETWNKVTALLAEMDALFESGAYTSEEMNQKLEAFKKAKGELLFAIQNLPMSLELKVGKSITLHPLPGDGKWNWEETYLQGNLSAAATFTALKEGKTTITYTTLQGVTQTVAVTIQKYDSTIPDTGDDLRVYPILLCVFFGTACVVLAKRSKKKQIV